MSTTSDDQSLSTIPPHRPLRHRRPSSSSRRRMVVKLTTAITICTLFMLLFGLTLTATVMTLVIATPLLVLFSPVLVPATLATVFVTAGFLISGSCGMAAAATLSWMYSYVAGKRPPGSEELEYGRVKIVDMAKQVKDMAIYYITDHRRDHHHHHHNEYEYSSKDVGGDDEGNHVPYGRNDHHYDYHPSSSSSSFT